MDKKITARMQPFDIFFLLRPSMLIPVWTFFLAGYWRGQEIPLKEIHLFMKESLLMNGKFWVSFVSYSLLLGSVYIINQIVDKESDKINKKLFLIPLRIVPVKFAIVLSIILVIISFLITFRFGFTYQLFLLFSLIIGVLYSVKPIRLKGRPILDILSNAFGYGILAFGVGWLTSSPFSERLFLYAIPYFFATATIFSASTILDTEGDRRDGAITTAVRFGKTSTLAICLITLLLSFISSLFLLDVIVGITSVLSLPLLFIAFTGQRREHITLYMRGASYVFIILMAVLYPWYIVLLLFIYIVSKLYYKFRFNIEYPRLREKREDW